MTPPVARSMRRNLGFMAVGTFVATLVQAALYFLLARHLGAETYGGYSLALTIALLCAPLWDQGLAVWIVRAVAQDRACLPATLGACLAWRGVLLLPAVVLSIGVCRIGDYGQDVVALIVPLLLVAFLDGLSTLATGVFQAIERMAWSAAVTVARSATRVAAFGVVWLAGGDVEVMAWAFVLSAALVAWPAWRHVIRLTPIRFERARMLPSLRAAWPFGFAIVATTLHAQVDVALLGMFVDPDSVGHFHAGMRFFFLAVLLPQTIAAVVAPVVHRRGLDGVAAVGSIYRVQVTALGTIGLALALALALHADVVVATVLGAEYAASEAIVLVVAPVVFLRFVSAPLVDMLSAIGLQSRYMVGCWTALGVNVVANLLLIPWLGIVGAAVATLISEVVVLTFVVATALAAGADIAWRDCLLRPLVAGAVLAIGVRGAAFVGVPQWQGLAWLAAIAVYVGGAWWRPTAEQRTLLRVGWRGGRTQEAFR